MYTSDNFHPNLIAFPEHIALIPDGGRRWAQKNGCTYSEAYSYSMQLILQLIDYALENGSKYYSVYFSSTSNFKRSVSEIHDFCTAEWTFLNDIFFAYALNNNVKIRIVGTDNNILNLYKDNIEKLEKHTSKGTRTVFFCFNYNSIDEIDIALKHSNAEKLSFVNYLQIPHPVDILIRTGNANVLSGFLLPQISSARIFFIKKLFNDFSLEDYKKIINEYLNYELKYGD